SDRDESVMAGVWPGNRLSRNTATDRNVGSNALFQSDYELAAHRHQVSYGMDYVDQTSKAAYGSTPFMDE
ncbi:TonB-dependent siderophore receptor, partial [Vibrio cholerae O1]|nr:TonB-dependent siderophore receptor [Vibrio cholerae O1]